MKLWLLEYILPLSEPPYDHLLNCVVRAETEEDARKLVSETPYYEGPDVWMNPEKSTCEEIKVDGPAEIILKDIG